MSRRHVLRFSLGGSSARLLPEEQRQDIAVRLFVPALLVERYESQCHQQDRLPDPQIVQSIVDTSINSTPERAMKLYGVYLDLSAQDRFFSQGAQVFRPQNAKRGHALPGKE